jgi:prepilin-type N-terminal cleavage/methylation domain-containing protein
MRQGQRIGRTAAGFSLLELLVVMGIIVIMTAVAMPGISSYMRNYKIKNAVQSVGGEITTARNKAIMKNVNWGVVFLIENDPQGRPTRYRFLIEDDQTPPRSSSRMAPGTILPPGNDPVRLAQVGNQQSLPEGIVFGTGCAGFAPNDKAFRFNRMGAWCDPLPLSTDLSCATFIPPTPPAAAANLIMNAANVGARICLVQTATGLRREVRVSPGGRVLQEDRQR